MRGSWGWRHSKTILRQWASSLNCYVLRLHVLLCVTRQHFPNCLNDFAGIFGFRLVGKVSEVGEGPRRDGHKHTHKGRPPIRLILEVLFDQLTFCRQVEIRKNVRRSVKLFTSDNSTVNISAFYPKSQPPENVDFVCLPTFGRTDFLLFFSFAQVRDSVSPMFTQNPKV